MQQQEEDWVSLLMEIKLKEKVGLQRTLSNSKMGETWTVPLCETLAMSPLGNLTEMWTIEVMEVKNWMEWIIWSVAPLSKIQSLELMWVVTVLEEKTEYSKEGADQIPETSCPWRAKEDWVGWVMMLATWCVSEPSPGVTCVPKWLWEFSKPSNCWYLDRVKLTLSSREASAVTTLLAKEAACGALFLNL